MFVRGYLRASTKEQDAGRARADLERFADERGLSIAAFYEENESGATLKRPELERLLRDCRPGDVLLVEQVDRLSRLNGADWERLQADLKAKRVRVVALDLPTSWQMIKEGDEFTQRMADAINSMMLEMLAAIARKDYEDRRRRQAQGIAKAKAQGRMKGRREDTKRNSVIMAMLKAGQSWSQIVGHLGCSRATVAKLAKRVSESDQLVG
jgi:DNA invertase Pin-like site-specific DNA recombinase